MKKFILSESEKKEILNFYYSNSNISEQTEKTPEYTVKSDFVMLTGQNKKTTAAAEDLKIFGGAKFVKEGNTMVANTKYQFFDSLGNQIIGAGSNPGMRSSKNYEGKVTYGCSTGKFTVNMRTDLMFYDKKLSPVLQKKCQIKVDNTQKTTDPKIKTQNNSDTNSHPCDTNNKKKIAKGKSFDYCFVDNKYYFKGTKGDFLTKHPNWTEASGTGLEAIKTKIFPKTASWEKFPCVVNHPNAVKKTMSGGSYIYDINGVIYYNNGRKTSSLGNVNYTCDDPEFKQQ